MKLYPLLLCIALLCVVSCISLKSSDRSIPLEKHEKYFLTIDSGGHMDLIRGLIFTKDNRFLISASMDKTIRVWDVQSGVQQHIIRGQIGKGLEGSIYDIALSPDNEWLAAAGMLTECT